MLIKERIQLTEYVQSLNITANTRKNHFTPIRKRKSNSTSIHHNSLVKMIASTTISETQQIPEQGRCKSVQKEMSEMDRDQRGGIKAASKTKKKFHITDSHNQNFSATLYPRYIGNENETIKGVTDRRKSEAASALQGKRSINEPIRIASKINLTKKSKTGKDLLVNDSHFQSWINEVLMQSCNQKFDTSVALSAVKKYMVDSASLTAFGIKSSDVSRIYRSLHIYSVGFSKMLKEMRGVTTKVYRNVWKVYSILLEYCSSGDFQTMLSVVCNQNERKIQQLEDELQQKQDIIQKNDQLNRQKNSKVFKEIKVLKEENFQLNLEKEVIINDCKDYQKAFSEEVSLRILFQDKINAVYSLYRELSDKHSTLYRDFQTKMSEITSLTEQNKKINDQNALIKREKYGIEADNKALNQESNQLKEQLGKLQQVLSKRSSQDSQWKLQRSSVYKQLSEAQNNCKKLTKQLQNSQDSNKLLRQTYHLLQLEYQQCLYQNRRLLSTLDEQYAINKSYFQQRQNLSKEVNDYENEKAVFQQKVAHKQKIIQQLRLTIEDLKEKLNSLRNEKEIADQNINQLKQSLMATGDNIKNLKAINTESQQTIFEQRIAIKNLQLEREQLKKARESANSVINQQKKELLKLNSQNASLSSQIQLLKKKVITELKSKQKSFQAQAQQKKQDDGKFKIVAKELASKHNQYQKYKQLYEGTAMSLNNERFEKKNLQLSYKQCLNVIQNYTSVIKDIHTKHSDLEEKLEEQKINHKLKELQLQHKISELTKLNIKLSQQNNKMNKFWLKHRDCVHPMLFEDALSQINKLYAKREEMEEFAKVLTSITKEGSQSFNETIKQKDQEIIVLSQKLKETKERLSLQLQYQQKKNYELSELLDESQLKLVALTNKNKAPIAQFRQKQRKYLEIIRQKRQESQNLILELEIMQDQNQRLVGKLNSSQGELSSQRQKLAEFQSNIALLQVQKKQIQSQRDSAIQEAVFLRKEQMNLHLDDYKGDYHKEFQATQRLAIQSEGIRKSTAGKSLVLSSSSGGKTKQIYWNNQSVQNECNHKQTIIKPDEKESDCSKLGNRIATDKLRRQDFSKKFKNASQYYLK